jgi:outer membrane protein TolC
MVTEADVLSLQVHLAQVQEREIRAASDEMTAKAALNRLMGFPLDRPLELEQPSLGSVELPELKEIEHRAILNRGAARKANLAAEQAAAARSGARASLLPQVSLQGGYEWNGASFGSRSGAWNLSVQARWNLFAGLGDLARVRAAGAARDGAEALRKNAEQGLLLEARISRSQLEAALAREGVGRTAVLHALESQRIIRDRYESGLAGVNEVLRAANAVLDAEALRIAAVVDVMVGRAAVRKAMGEAAGS